MEELLNKFEQQIFLEPATAAKMIKLELIDDLRRELQRTTKTVHLTTSLMNDPRILGLHGGV